jgi:anti-sigma B factor antagonist
MSQPALTPDVTIDRGVTVIGLGPGYETLDESVLDAGLRQALNEAVDVADPPRVVLDLTHTTFFGSSFIEILFGIWHRLQGRPAGNFAICGLTAYCQEVLKITHLDTLWRLYATREEAIRSMA